MKTLQITNGVVFLDEEDYERVAQHTWHVNNTGYAYHKCRKWTASMHRFILDYTGPLITDHINNNKLDNRKENLRLVTQVENQLNRKSIQTNNSTGFNGVCKTKYGYQAYKHIKGKRKHLGYYHTAERASKIRGLFDQGVLCILRGKIVDPVTFQEIGTI